MADAAPPTDLSTPPAPGVSLNPDPSAIAETGAALDALFAAAPGVAPDAAAEAEKAAAEKAEADRIAAEKAKGTPPPVVTEPTAEEKVAAEKAAADAAAAAKDEFDKVVLPPHTKPAVAQSFDALKKASRDKVAAVEKEREELRTKVTELEGRPAVDPKVEEELKQLREFRQKLDVEADPTFKEYFEEIKTNDEAIFNKLKESGASEALLVKMREIGTKELDWDTVLDKLPPVARRYVENKLAVNEDLSEQRDRAIETAKKNASEFLAEREKQNTQGELAHRAAAEEHFTKVSTQLPWFKIEKVPTTATPEEKAAIEADNKFYLDTQKSVKELLGDNSPQMRAIAALGYAQMLRLQAEIPALNAEHAAEKKTLSDEVAALKTQLKEKEDFIARIKKSSATSPREGNAPANPGAAASQPTFGEHGSTALDRHRAEQLANS